MKLAIINEISLQVLAGENSLLFGRGVKSSGATFGIKSREMSDIKFCLCCTPTLT